MLIHFSRGDNCVKTIDFINFIKVKSLSIVINFTKEKNK